ncbi:CII family transcriptional regulator, partial [Enterobacter kobei]
VVDDDMARLAKQVAEILTNKKRPAATERYDQMNMNF